MRETRVTFRSGPLLLEGARSQPVGTGPFPAVVVCHPHPSFGGSMENNVVRAICEGLYERSIMTLRFNFRGVGKSEGNFGHGIGEQDDVRAAISFLVGRKQSASSRMGFVGYSAGAVFGLPIAIGDAMVRSMAAISPPLGMMDLDALKTSRKPKMLVLGSKDDYTLENELTELCRSCAEPKECTVIQGADHFWQGYEHDLADRVSEFMARSLSSSLESLGGA